MRLTDALDQFYYYLQDEKNLSSLTLSSYSKDWNDVLSWLDKQGMDAASLDADSLTENAVRRYLYALNRKGLSRALRSCRPAKRRLSHILYPCRFPL